MLEFVKATESDKGYLLALRTKTIQQHLEESGLYLTEQEHLERVNHRYECSYLVFYQGTLIGMVKYKTTTKELELIQLQIDPLHQSKGYGTKIIQQILNGEKDRTVKLSVLKKNPAVELYKKLGFKIVGQDTYEYDMQKAN